MKDHNYWVETLKMERHPEGGYSSRTYESPHNITDNHLNSTFEGSRPLATSIYFLIHDNNVSNFHRLLADEVWYYHEGKPLIIAIIDENGDFSEQKLGLDADRGERPQVFVPAGSIFGAYIEDNSGYSLASCMVSFGFDFNDFELFTRTDLQQKYPSYSKIITRLTPEK